MYRGKDTTHFSLTAHQFFEYLSVFLASYDRDFRLISLDIATFRQRRKSIHLAFALVVEEVGHLAERHDVRESLDAGGPSNGQKRNDVRIDDVDGEFPLS